METKRERSSEAWTGLLLLALGVAIGALLEPARWFERSAPERAPEAGLPTAQGASAPRENGLAAIALAIPPESMAVLQRVRAAALERGVIVQTDADTVPAEFRFEGTTLPAEIRLKGDWVDHVEDERWSLRIRLREGSFLGMREFSIQQPKTRGYLWEWLVQSAARREGVLVPRSTFLNVVQNENAMGVYFLEEHFEKELLESQGRREGPIVVWDESVLWSTLLQEGNVPAKGVQAFESRLTEAAHTVAPAEVRAFGEKRLSSIDSLNQLLHGALDQMRGLRALALAELPEVDRGRVLEAMEELRGRTLEDLVDVERLGAAHALCSVFQVFHALAWHNTRWYRDPVKERLEPILFDAAAQEPSERDPVPFRSRDLTQAFARSPAYQAALFEHLGRMLRSDWLEQLFAAIEPELARFEAAVAAGEELPRGFRVDEMKQRLRAEVVYLRRVALPEDAANFSAEYALLDPLRDPGEGWLEVRAWATTRSPAFVEGFRFSNGSFTPARGALAPGQGAVMLRGQAVLLPCDGSALAFRFPMDQRLANLESVEKLTRALREALTPSPTLDLDVDVDYRLAASEATQVERLLFRRRPPPTELEGRPPAPSLEEVLERHAFLRYDFTRHELTALAGVHAVSGDLVLPAGLSLRLGPGTTLRFGEGAVLLADAPLFFEGSAAAPVVLEPLGTEARFAGVVVLGARGRSEWSDVLVRGTTAVARGGWVLTGAVTFYRSAVTLRRCTFDDNTAEDSLNVFGADLLFDAVTFSGARSDAFDGDFVTGTIQNCVFRDGLADGLDVSGSDVTIRGCRFERLGDKGCSIGERSRARIEGGSMVDVAVGVAAKDASEVTLQGMHIAARHYALAAFVKKPEYGPSRLVAHDLRVSGAAPTAIAQTGCVLELEGELVPTQAIDVEAAYQEGTLGRAK